MKKPNIIKLPSVKIPNSTANDYACASYNGHIDFSCKPYGSEGNIDVSNPIVGGVIGGGSIIVVVGIVTLT